MSESTPLTNGTSPSSKFLSHLNSYPVVSDGVETFKSNPYGKKSLDLADSAYQKLGKPIEPYLETPYSYAKPYVAKADELASSGLDHVETRFPIVKEETNTIIDTGKSIVWYPFKLAGNGRDYVMGTYQDEYKKTSSHNNRGEGLQTLVLALISTQLKFASDFFQTIADFLGPKYEESKQSASAYAKQAQDKADEYKKYGQEKLGQYQKKGEDYVKQAQDKGEEYAKQAQGKAEEYQKEGQKKGEQVKKEAESKKEEAKKQVGGK